MKNQRDTKIILNDLSFVISSRISMQQAKPFFAGLLYEIILNKEIIAYNKQLPHFVNDIIISTANLTANQNGEYTDIPFLKPYIFSSRTNVAARISRIIIEKFDYNAVVAINEAISNYIKENSVENLKKLKPTNSSSSLIKELDNWLGANHD